MPTLTIRNVSEATRDLLRERAKAHGRSTEAEVRQILDDVVASAVEFSLVDLLARVREETGGVDLESLPRGRMRPLDLE